MEIKGKNVFITGSTRGIGLAMAHQFAGLGANIVLNGRSAISDELVETFKDYGVKVVPISGDVSEGLMLSEWLMRLLSSLALWTF